MKKFENVILFSDIDGTLTNDDGVISKENLEAIEYFTSGGGKFIISSGRYHNYAETKLGYKSEYPIIALNGTHIYDVKSGKDLWAKSLNDKEKSVAMSLFEKCAGHDNVIVCLNCRKSTAICKTVKDLNDALFGANEIHAEAFKAVFVSDKELLNELCEYAQEHFSDIARVVKSSDTLLEVLPLGTGKHICIEKLCEYFGGDPTVVAVGDHSNDIEMITKADIGYAVENAIPELKAVADRIAPKNTEHAIAYVVKELENI